MMDDYTPSTPLQEIIWEAWQARENDAVRIPVSDDPMDYPIDYRTRTINEDHPFWQSTNLDPAEFSFVTPESLEVDPESIIRPLLVTPDTLLGESEIHPGDADKLRPISAAEAKDLGENELFLQLGDACYAVSADEPDCSTLAYNDGMILFTDEDNDGVIERVEDIKFSGERKGWRVSPIKKSEL